MKRVDPVLVWLGLVVLLFADLLFLPRMIYGRDINSYFLPLESAVHRAWASGHLPLWFGAVSGGKPLLPNPNSGAFYPLRLAAAALSPAAGFALSWSRVLAGWGAIRLARALGMGAAPSSAAAVYALSGPSMSALLFLEHASGRGTSLDRARRFRLAERPSAPRRRRGPARARHPGRRAVHPPDCRSPPSRPGRRGNRGRAAALASRPPPPRSSRPVSSRPHVLYLRKRSAPGPVSAARHSPVIPRPPA